MSYQRHGGMFNQGGQQQHHQPGQNHPNQFVNGNPNIHPNSAFGMPPGLNPAMNAFRMSMGHGMGFTGQPNPPPIQHPHGPARAAAVDDDEEVIMEGDNESQSRICICIRSPVVITGNSNLVASDASQTANAIAMGIVSSLRQLSMGQHGIPMIDEQGRPRPINVEVIAGMHVDGSQNVIGERAVLSRMLELKDKAKERKANTAASETAAATAPVAPPVQTQNHAYKPTTPIRRSTGPDHGEEDAEPNAKSNPVKRERDSSEEVEAEVETEKKRSRRG